jgi:hypothetical protein
MVLREREGVTVTTGNNAWIDGGNQPGNSPGTLGNGRVISYNLREDERPDGLKVRYKVRIETGKRAAALNAAQAEAIREFLQWASQHHTPPAR